jgi:UDPglucose 6-dehydrogenase
VPSTVLRQRERHEYDLAVLYAAVDINVRQLERLLALMNAHVDVASQRVAILGLDFKPETVDVGNSRAILVIDSLRGRDVMVVAYDPVAVENMRARAPKVEYTSSAVDALVGASAALVVLTGR